jgi:hypothetical protein
VSGRDCQVNKHQIWGRGLTNACARSYKDGAFTDLTITCGPLAFPVHIVVVCSSCDFFRKSLSFAAGREAEERCIDLPEDDPEMIRRLIAYLYLGDYDPCDGLSISRYAGLRQHESAIPLPENHHPRYRNGTFGSVTFASDLCACLAPNPRDISQPVSCNSASQTLPSDYKLVEKAANTVEVANPLTIHATMYALGDKYQVDGLCQLAKEKFESCLHHHAHTEDFVSAVQLAYSSTPDTNRGLRDVVLSAFRTQFQVDVKGIPGAEEKLDSIDELSFALIKSWPVKTEPVKSKPVAKVSVAVVSHQVLTQQNTTAPAGFFGAPRPAQPTLTQNQTVPLFGSTRPAQPAATQNTTPSQLGPSRPVQPAATHNGGFSFPTARPAQPNVGFGLFGSGAV